MPRGRVCAWRGVRHVRGDTSPVTCSRGYTPARICVTVVRQTRRVGKAARQRLPTASLAKFTKPNAAMPTHADSTHPTIQPLRYTTPPGLFGVYMRSSALAYFRQHGASDYHQTATRVSTSRILPTNPYRCVWEVRCHHQTSFTQRLAYIYMTHKGILGRWAGGRETR